MKKSHCGSCDMNGIRYGQLTVGTGVGDGSDVGPGVVDSIVACVGRSTGIDVRGLAGTSVGCSRGRRFHVRLFQ